MQKNTGYRPKTNPDKLDHDSSWVCLNVLSSSLFLLCKHLESTFISPIFLDIKEGNSVSKYDLGFMRIGLLTHWNESS